MSKFKPVTGMVIHETPLEKFHIDNHGNFIIELDDIAEQRLRVIFSNVIFLQVTLEDCIDLTTRGIPAGAERYILEEVDSKCIARMASTYEERNPEDNLMEQIKHYVMLVGDHWAEVVAMAYKIEYM